MKLYRCPSLFIALLGFVYFISAAPSVQAQSAPIITVAPADTTGVWNQSGIMSVTATNATAYQWYRGESGDTASPVAGATGPLLVTPALSANTRFWVRVTNINRSVDSPSATVSIVVPPQPLVLAAMGANTYGQLGDGSTTLRQSPVQIIDSVATSDAGVAHGLFVKTDGSLWAMGANDSGQLGDGSYASRQTPVQIATSVASVSAGSSHSLFVKNDGSLWATGKNHYGQLGGGSSIRHTTPIQIATGVASVSAGGSHTLFIKTDGSLWAMGDNNSGQLGDGTYTSRPTPVQIATGVAFASAGAIHSLFIKTDGSLWATGDNSSGQLGDASTTARISPVQVAAGVVSVSAGNSHSMFVKTDGSLWGMGSPSLLGDGNDSNMLRVSPVQITTGVASVSASANHTVFVKTDGSLWATGNNNGGQLGGDNPSWLTTPVQLATGAISVSAGSAYTLFVARAYTVTFNLGTHATHSGGGELSQVIRDGSAAIAPTMAVTPGWAFTGWDHPFTSVTGNLAITANYVVPTQPIISTPLASVEIHRPASAILSVAATSNAPLAYQWYRGESGDTASPVAGATGPLLVTPALFATSRFWVRVTNAGLSTDSPATTVAVKDSRSLALATMGRNEFGQLGDGTTTSRHIPIQIGTGIASASAGANHTMFIKTDGSLWVMGDNASGQLGDGSYISRSSPVYVTNGVSSVSAGGIRYYGTGNSHSMFVKTDGSLWAMGYNSHGQLGDGTYTTRISPVPITTGVVSVSAGYQHSLFVKADGTLWAMGNNYDGQLGNGRPYTIKNSPTQIATEVSSVSAGANHTLFIKTDGSLWAMGYNSAGQLGDGTTTTRISPVPITTGVVSVSAGSAYTLFIKHDGSLWAMGANSYGQLGDGTTTSRTNPVQIATGVASVSASETQTHFVKTDGSRWAMGLNTNSQLGDGSTTSRLSPVQITAHSTVSVSAGGTHALMMGHTFKVTFDLGLHATRSGGGELLQEIIVGGTATAPTLELAPGWVFTGWDQPFTSVIGNLVVNALYARPTPPIISETPSAKETDWQGSVTLAVKATANAALAYQWYRGETGDTTAPVPGATGPLLVTPALTATTRFWVRITNGNLSADSPAATVTVAAQTQLLGLAAMGNNTLGKLGDGTTTNRTAFTQVASGIASATANENHSLFLKTDGSLWAMGNNASGQLGDGSTTSRPTPVQIATGVASISAGGHHTLFVKTDGSLWAMGANSSGQLGDGSTTNRSTPIQVATGVASVSTGRTHTLFVKTDGSLWAMGANNDGQLGDGKTTTQRSIPVQIDTNVASVSAGKSHSLFIKTDGSLWVMGLNSEGQLGDGTTTTRAAPVQVASEVSSVSGGSFHSLFVKTDGSLWAMGRNYSGQLGDGSPTPNTVRSSPVQISTGVIAASAGGGHSHFIKTDRSLWAMGDNSFGQLGDGSTTNRPLPVQVAAGVACVSTGDTHTLFVASTHAVSFDLGAHATRSGGGELSQGIINGAAATAPTLSVASGWLFSAWDLPFASITGDLVITASYIAATQPIIEQSPVSTEVHWQRPTFLTVAAQANGPLAYQWYRGESGDTTAPVPGATGPLLVIPTPFTGSRFWVRVTNGGLYTDSLAATLSVTTPALAPNRPWLLAAMGANTAGQLGPFSGAFQSSPRQVTSAASAVAAGFSKSLYIKSDFSLWGLGDNLRGELGTTDPYVRSPIQISTGIASVSSASTHTLYIKTDGTLWGLGYNPVIGLGSLGGSNSEPKMMATNAVSVSASSSRGFFIKADGSLWALGVSAPVQIATEVASVSTGGQAVFIKYDGSLWAIGNNNSLIQITTGVTSVAAGGSHTLFIKGDNSLWAMGTNSFGQLGDGSTTNRTTPVQIATDVISIAAGQAHSLFIKSDRSLWAMGANSSGQLGDGSTTNRTTPVQIATNAVSVSAGLSHTLFIAQGHTITFNLGAHATRSGGGELSQAILPGASATAPHLTVSPGWLFTGWDQPFTSVTGDLTITARYLATLAFSDWATTRGISGADATPSADPDGDGMSNLLEYYFGTSPTIAGSVAGPAVATDSVGGQPALRITHRRLKTALATVVYQTSSNLAAPESWTAVSVMPTVVDPDVDGDGLVEVVAVSIPLPPNTPVVFARLQITE